MSIILEVILFSNIKLIVDAFKRYFTELSIDLKYQSPYKKVYQSNILFLLGVIIRKM